MAWAEEGINWAGYIAWGIGFLVGIPNHIPGIPAAWVAADNPSVLYSFGAGFVIYLLLAKLGFQPPAAAAQHSEDRHPSRRTARNSSIILARFAVEQACKTSAGFRISSTRRRASAGSWWRLRGGAGSSSSLSPSPECLGFRNFSPKASCFPFEFGFVPMTVGRRWRPARCHRADG